MAVYTPLSVGEARALGARWGLEVVAVRGVDAGSNNSSYALGLSGGGRAFLRIYEGKGADVAEREARVIDHLAARGVPTPRPRSLVGRGGVEGAALVTAHAGKPAMVFPWVEGETLCQGRVTPARARRVGEALARLHLAAAAVEAAPEGRFRPPDLLARLDAIEARPISEEVAAAARALRARLAPYLEGPPAPEVPLIHADLFRDNVLWAGEEIVAVLDFECASSGSIPFDIMTTVLAWCYGDALDWDLARALVGGYAAARPISPEERAHLHDQAVLVALRFSITRITDFELRTQGTGGYRDFRRFLARLRELDAVGPAAWPAALGL